MRKYYTLIALILLLSYGLVIPVNLDGLTVKEATLKELTNESFLVIHGTVVEQSSRWDVAQRNIYTYNTIRLSGVLKGSIKGKSVLVRELGGKVGDTEARVSGLKYLRKNEEVLLFLRKTEEEEVYKIHSFALGKFSVFTENGKRKVRHALGSAKAFYLEKSTVPADAEKPPTMDLQKFVRKVNSVR